MLVLTRRVGESIRIGDDVVITLVQVGAGKVRIGIQAPNDKVILREELAERSSNASPAVVTTAVAAAMSNNVI